MELLGSNLLEYKKAMVSFNAVSTYKIFSDLIDAIEEIHKKGVIHQDIKPSNILLFNNELKLIDFGLARTEDDEYVCDNLSSLTYASPNLHYGKVLGKKDDLFSFLFVVLELLNQNLPWKEDKVIIYLHRIIFFH
jgi:tau tubulin kinase